MDNAVDAFKVSIKVYRHSMVQVLIQAATEGNGYEASEIPDTPSSF